MLKKKQYMGLKQIKEKPIGTFCAQIFYNPLALLNLVVYLILSVSEWIAALASPFLETIYWVFPAYQSKTKHFTCII